MIQVRWLLSNPRNERRLLRAFLTSGGFCLVWMGTQAGVFLQDRYKIVAAQKILQRQRHDVRALLTPGAPQPSAPQHLNLSAPDAGGGPAFVEALNTPHIGGVQIRSVRFPASQSSISISSVVNADVPGGSTPALGTNASPVAAQAAAPPAAGSIGSSDAGEWVKQPFDCESEGDYADLLRFQKRLTELSQIIELTRFELVRTRVDTQRHKALLDLKLSGTLYGLPEDQSR